MTEIDDLTSTAVVLKSLIQESKDGEWGKGEPFEDSVKMAVIRGTDFEAVRNGNIDGLPIRYIPKRIADRKTLQPNDILLETAGGSKDRPTGRSLFIKSSIIHRSELPLICASFSRFIRIDPTKADPRYIFWHLQYLYDADYLRQYHTQHTGVARFQYTVFSEREELLLPSIHTQRKIAAIISAYDDLIENNTRRIEILEEMARSLYREWFVKFRSETEKVENRTLNDICEFIVDCEHKTAPTQATGYPSIRTPNIGRGRLLLDKVNRVSEETYKAWTKRAIPKEDDLILAREAPVGNVAIIPKNIKVCLGQRTVLIRPDLGKVKPYYLLLLLVSDEIQNKLLSLSNGATVHHLNMRYIRSLELPELHLLPIQDKINTLISDYYNLIFNLTRKIENLRQTRDLLLPKIISGEIDVENLDINTGEIAA